MSGGVAELGDARRAFVHRQIAADAVAGAVVEVEAGLPQRLPGERVELRAGGAVGEHRARDRDMALQHAGEALAHFIAHVLAGSPIATVRVMSVVPSSYWPPESIRNSSPGAMVRLVERVTR